MKVIVFDWGDTLMKDFSLIDPLTFKGPMISWPVVELIPGVEKAINELSRKYLCCVASNAGDSNAVLMGEALARVGIKTYFSYLITSTELGVKKPDEMFFKKILEYLNVSPEEAISVGNDYFKDILPARKIGMKTILFDKIGQFKDSGGIDFVISSMDQLPVAVENLY